MTRREEREMAFILCFESAVTNVPMQEAVDGAVEIREEEVPEFCGRLAFGVEKNIDEIDSYIEKNIRKGWTKSRLSKVSLSVLRVAIYELLYERDIPYSVSVNEAVELSKLYGEKDSAPFVNGVLSSIVKELSEKQ